jgi:hypothetical protein
MPRANRITRLESIDLRSVDNKKTRQMAGSEFHSVFGYVSLVQLDVRKNS